MRNEFKIVEYKGYNIERLGTYPMVKIKAKGQGSIPDALGGVYTTHTAAERAIDVYLGSLMKGRKANGKTENISTS